MAGLIEDRRPMINIGMIGYAFMGKAHSSAYRDVARYFPELERRPVLRALAGRTEGPLRAAAELLGWESIETDAMALINRPDIDVVDVSSPGHAHHAQVLACAAAGKHVLCEKPIANTLAEAREMAAACRSAGVRSFVMFNYRRVPAVRLAQEMIAAGELGEIRHFRACYLQDWIAEPDFPMVWRLDKRQAGSGALGDIGSHIADLGRFLVGELTEVCATMKTFVKERPVAPGSAEKGQVTVDDAAAWLGHFENGAVGTYEVSRFARGRKNFNGFEVYGSKGSLSFNFEDMNRLHYFDTRDGARVQGFRDILVTEASHPYLSAWWPSGHLIGYQHTFANAVFDFLQSLRPGAPEAGPTMDDGLAVQAILHAIEQSAGERQWAPVQV